MAHWYTRAGNGASARSMRRVGAVLAGALLISASASFAHVAAPTALAAAGDLDPTFGTGGTVITPSGAGYDYAFSVAVQGDGKIVAAGECSIATTFDFCLARYNGDGSLDTTFDLDGKVTTAIGVGTDSARSVVIQSDGKIVAAGGCVIGTTFDFCLARYNGDGSLDTTFDLDGKVTTAIGPSGDLASSVAVQGDGKIVAAGACATVAGQSCAFYLARYNGDGSLDTTFDLDGKVTTDVGPSSDLATSVAIQGDGKIVAAGACATVVGSTNDFCLARYDDGGTTNQAPTDVALSAVSVAENQASGMTVGSFSSADPDGGDIFTYTLVAGTGDTDNAAFTIAAGALRTAASFDYETKNSYTIRVRSTDSGGLTVEKPFTISVTDANEAPVGANDLYSAVQGNPLSIAAAIGVLANDTDPDSGASLTAIFTAGPSNGVLTLNANGSFTYTPNAVFAGADTFTYRASDGLLPSNIVTVTINVASSASIIDAQVGLTGGQKSSLKDKLAAAQAFYIEGKLGPACGKLDQFIAQVNSLTPTKLSASTATALITGATARKALYGCPSV